MSVYIVIGFNGTETGEVQDVFLTRDAAEREAERLYQVGMFYEHYTVEQWDAK